MSYIDTQNLKDYTIQAKDGDIGHISDFYFDEDLFYLRYLVVDTEPFLLRNLVVISPISFRKINSDEKIVELNITKKELEDSPRIDSVDVISRQYEMAYNDYFSWPYYWGYGNSAWAIGPYGITGGYYGQLGRNARSIEEKISEQKGNLKKEAKENNLRSSREVRSYSVMGKDNQEFGHIQGFILDPITLSIDFIIIDTINYFPSKNVLLRPEWIEEISWKSKTVKFPFTKELIKSAPPYKKGEIDEKLIKTSDEHFKNVYHKDLNLFQLKNNSVFSS